MAQSLFVIHTIIDNLLYALPLLIPTIIISGLFAAGLSSRVMILLYCIQLVLVVLATTTTYLTQWGAHPLSNYQTEKTVYACIISAVVSYKAISEIIKEIPLNSALSRFISAFAVMSVCTAFVLMVLGYYFGSSIFSYEFSTGVMIWGIVTAVLAFVVHSIPAQKANPMASDKVDDRQPS